MKIHGLREMLRRRPCRRSASGEDLEVGVAHQAARPEVFLGAM